LNTAKGGEVFCLFIWYLWKAWGGGSGILRQFAGKLPVIRGSCIGKLWGKLVREWGLVRGEVVGIMGTTIRYGTRQCFQSTSEGSGRGC